MTTNDPGPRDTSDEDRLEFSTPEEANEWLYDKRIDLARRAKEDELRLRLQLQELEEYYEKELQALYDRRQKAKITSLKVDPPIPDDHLGN
jgi:hypothetical protein